jgi:hypothetical protein
MPIDLEGGASGSGGGITNGAGANVVTKSNGTNLVASSISDNGTTVNTTELVTITKADSSAVTDLLINPAVKTSGNLIDAQVGGASKFSVSNTGIVNIPGPVSGATSGVLKVGEDTGNGRDGLYLKKMNSISGDAPYQYAFLVADYIPTQSGNQLYGSFAGRAMLAKEQLVLGPLLHMKWYTGVGNDVNYYTPRTGLAEVSAGVLKVTDGSTGLGQLQLSIPAYADNAAAVAALGANRLYYTDTAGEYIVKITH